MAGEADYGAQEELARRALKLYAAGLHQLDGVRFGRRWHGLLLLLATRTYNTALLALVAIHDGYPIKSIILSRSIYENVLTAGYVRRYPRQARFWLAKKYMADKASESIPRFGAMRAKEDKDTREKLKQMYGVMSQFAHPRPRGLWAEHELRGKVSHLRLGPRADEGQTIAAHYVLLSLLPHALRVVALFIAQHDAAWWQAVQALTTETAEWLKAENQNARAAKLRSAPPVTAKSPPLCRRDLSRSWPGLARSISIAFARAHSARQQ